MTEQNEVLIQQNDVEKVLTKLNSFKEDNLTAKEKEKKDNIGIRFAEHFDDLRWRLIGISDDQLKKLDRKETKIFADVIAKKAKPWAMAQMIFLILYLLGCLAGGVVSVSCGFLEAIAFLIIFGWMPPMVVIAQGESWHYLRYRRTLKKAYGENYFPRNYLKYLK